MKSKRKGQRIEREAAAFLQSLGFTSARRTAQKIGGPDTPDVRAEELSGVHLEVKGDESIDIGRQALRDAWAQAERDAQGGRTPAVLWKRKRSGWRLTFRIGRVQLLVTVDSADDIRTALQLLNRLNLSAKGESRGERGVAKRSEAA